MQHRVSSARSEDYGEKKSTFLSLKKRKEKKKRQGWSFPPTSEVRSVRQLHLLVVLGDDARDAVLDEVHLFPHGALADDVIVGLEDLELQLAQHSGDEVGIGVGEQRHGRDQFPTVKVNDLLQKHSMKRNKNKSGSQCQKKTSQHKD